MWSAQLHSYSMLLNRRCKLSRARLLGLPSPFQDRARDGRQIDLTQVSAVYLFNQVVHRRLKHPLTFLTPFESEPLADCGVLAQVQMHRTFSRPGQSC